VDANKVPRLANIYSRNIPRRVEILSPATILAPDGNGGYVVAPEYKLPEVITKQDGIGAINTGVNTNNNNVLGVELLHRKGVISNNRPKYVPNVVRKGYQEFP
jgi:hypothetical protein